HRPSESRQQGEQGGSQPHEQQDVHESHEHDGQQDVRADEQVHRGVVERRVAPNKIAPSCFNGGLRVQRVIAVLTGRALFRLANVADGPHERLGDDAGRGGLSRSTVIGLARVRTPDAREVEVIVWTGSHGRRECPPHERDERQCRRNIEEPEATLLERGEPLCAARSPVTIAVGHLVPSAAVGSLASSKDMSLTYSATIGTVACTVLKSPDAVMRPLSTTCTTSACCTDESLCAITITVTRWCSLRRLAEMNASDPASRPLVASSST